MKDTMCGLVKEVNAPSGLVYHTDLPIPEINDDEVLIKVHCSAICGTDLHIMEWDEWSQKRIKAPVTVGHETAGEIVAVGKNVTERKVGDRVSCESHIPCGECYFCKNGMPHICKNVKLFGCTQNGAFAEYAKIRWDCTFLLEDDVTEDAQLQGATLPLEKPYLEISPWTLWKKRSVWLLLLFVAEAYTSSVLQHFEEALESAIALAFFIPLLIGTGGNSGTQASTAVIRALSLGEVRFSDLLRVVWKECRVALICGVCLAAANFVKMMVVDCWLLANPTVTPAVAAVVCCTLVGTVACAKLVGASLPILAEKIGFDPAVMASPFISTIVDALSLLIYFRFATWILGV